MISRTAVKNTVAPAQPRITNLKRANAVICLLLRPKRAGATFPHAKQITRLPRLCVTVRREMQILRREMACLPQEGLPNSKHLAILDLRCGSIFVRFTSTIGA